MGLSRGLGILLSPRASPPGWEVKTALGAHPREGVVQDDGQARHQHPAPTVFAPRRSRFGVVPNQLQRLRDPLHSTRSFPSLTDRKVTHTPGDFSSCAEFGCFL